MCLGSYYFITIDKHMHNQKEHQEKCFTPFKQPIIAYNLPEKFTFPFYYDPHPLCLLAVKEVQHHLETQSQWQHNFGITGNTDKAIGKMFGVLLVRNKDNEIGYLTAFSGKLAEKNIIDKFVPPVFDMLTNNSFFKIKQLEINDINNKIETLESNPQIAEFELALATQIAAANVQIEIQRECIILGRKYRKSQRASAESKSSLDDLLQLNSQLSKESIIEKNQLKNLKHYWNERISKAQRNIDNLTDEINLLKDMRKTLSGSLQSKLFERYLFLNINGGLKNLHDIFDNTAQRTPPAGSGECAAPKLLHYAFKWGMRPLALAEFWWGASPKSEIRQHKNFYPACQGKCQPILEHMLEDIPMDENPLLVNPAEGKTLNIIYQDDVMLLINKPAEFLSVPGKTIVDSVYQRIKQAFPNATGPLIVHRLDMSTSGLMVIALNKRAHKNLQKQFINRTVTKRYVALIDGDVKNDEGIINLPLRVNLNDRPRQLVCFEHGKPAETKWQVIERKYSATINQTKLYLYPKTGRTHQLRVHCAHYLGLNIPILGDDLYGRKANRLYLHAQRLEFNHPITKVLMHFQVDADF